MAGPGDPFTPGPTADPTAGIPNMQDFENLRNQWATFLDQPGARAALLQFGTTLMQTPGFGETPIGQIGRAIGAGGEAVSRQQEQESKQAEREARAAGAEARAGIAEKTLGLRYFQQQAMDARTASLNVRASQDAWRRDMQNLDAAYAARKKLWDSASLTDPQKAGPEPKSPEELGLKLPYDQWIQSPRGAGYATLPGVREIVQGARGQPAPRRPTTTDNQTSSDSGDEGS